MTVAINPGDNWQTKTDANPAGTVFDVAAGTHVNQSVTPKAGNQYNAPAPVNGVFGVIMDGSGTTQYAFQHGAAHPDSVALRNIEVKNYNPPTQMAAVRISGFAAADGGTDWVAENIYAHDNANCGLRCGTRTHVLGGRFSNNGQMGVSGIGDDILVDGAQIDGNNPTAANLGFEAGGTKFVLGSRLILRNNWVWGNKGPGLWLDIDNFDYLIEDNLAEDNLQESIVAEISWNGIIRRNRVFRGGLDDTRASSWLWGAGIAASASGGTGLEIYENLVVGSVHGIVGLQQNRGNSGVTGTPYLVQNLDVHDNTVVMQTIPGHTQTGSIKGYGIVTDVGTNSVFDTQGNSFSNNRLILESAMTGSPYAWKNGYQSFATWQGNGQDGSGKQLIQRNMYFPRSRN